MQATHFVGEWPVSFACCSGPVGTNPHCMADEQGGGDGSDDVGSFGASTHETAGSGRSVVGPGLHTSAMRQPPTNAGIRQA